MPTTPQEIHAKQFTTRSNKWFDKAEVTDFLDQIAVDYDNLLQENQSLRTKLTEADANATQVEEMKQSVNSSILIAQEAADRLKKQTEAEAEATLQQAQTEAQKIVMEANAKANALLTESQQKNETLVARHETLQREMTEFKGRIANLLNAQLDLLDSDGWAEFQGPTAAVEQNSQVAAPAYQQDQETTTASSEMAPSADAGAKTETVVIFPDLDDTDDTFLNKD
ncbi:DivIVA domain-containing protein [Weissella halotolerans]|uniref:Cell division initiation protein n=1 Tax=Weissella halotolerans DSM 20190 TaxID=1123500 RepID=A0A0R2FTG6_9LACO|nr:DivIVA domain-containing protein [Weissella halotolerans]KRN31747.1 cell division initiation protein [Weissella halotolerans DSM 20190]